MNENKSEIALPEVSCHGDVSSTIKRAELEENSNFKIGNMKYVSLYLKLFHMYTHQSPFKCEIERYFLKYVVFTWWEPPN